MKVKRVSSLTGRRRYSSWLTGCTGSDYRSASSLLLCQADLINQLYQGKLKDYVRCLECGYESWRIDTYLDIPLVIRPFGASQAFCSVVRRSGPLCLRSHLRSNHSSCDCTKLTCIIATVCLVCFQGPLA